MTCNRYDIHWVDLEPVRGAEMRKTRPAVIVSLDVLNLFDRKASDIEYWGGACTRNEALQGRCNGGIDGRLVHPLEPRSLRASLRIGF